MKTLYTAHVTTVAGRAGHSETDDKQLSVTLSKPSGDKPGTNPEQLFAMGYSACFGSAIEAIAKKQQANIGEVKVQADVSLNQDEDNGFFISVALNVSVGGVERPVAQKLVEAAHQVCPYSKATRGNINVILKVNNTPLSEAA